VAVIFRFLGRKAVEGARVTTAFLRWLLATLFATLRTAAHRAPSLFG
jgi:hypothetical protein